MGLQLTMSTDKQKVEAQKLAMVDSSFDDDLNEHLVNPDELRDLLRIKREYGRMVKSGNTGNFNTSVSPWQWTDPIYTKDLKTFTTKKPKPKKVGQSFVVTKVDRKNKSITVTGVPVKMSSKRLDKITGNT